MVSVIKKEAIGKIIESLQKAIKRPQMYFGVDDDPSLVQSYLCGIDQASVIFLEVDYDFIVSKWRDAIESRGHKVTTRAPAWHLKEQGVADKDIIIELIQIHIALYTSILREDD